MSHYRTQLEAIASAMDADLADDVIVHICYGPPRCMKADGQNCPDCYRVDSHDSRTPEQIRAEMNRTH